MKIIYQAFGELNEFDINDHLKCLQSLFNSMKICIVVKDVVMMLLVPAESVL